MGVKMRAKKIIELLSVSLIYFIVAFNLSQNPFLIAGIFFCTLISEYYSNVLHFIWVTFLGDILWGGPITLVVYMSFLISAGKAKNG